LVFIRLRADKNSYVFTNYLFSDKYVSIFMFTVLSCSYICLTTKAIQQVKGNTSYLVGTVISPNLSYLLAVRLAASTANPFNTHKIKKKNIAN